MTDKKKAQPAKVEEAGERVAGEVVREDFLEQSEERPDGASCFQRGAQSGLFAVRGEETCDVVGRCPDEGPVQSGDGAFSVPRNTSSGYICFICFGQGLAKLP